MRRGQTQDKGVIGTLQKWKGHLASEGIVITQLQLIETILECCSSIVKLSVCQEKSEIQIFIMCHPLIFKKGWQLIHILQKHGVGQTKHVYELNSTHGPSIWGVLIWLVR